MSALLDLFGKRFGRLIAIERTRAKSRVVWRCKCDCGKEVVVETNYLTSGNTKSCGCLRDEKTRIRNVKDILGEKFGLLTVIARKGSNEEGKALWLCECECGGTKIVTGKNLRTGNTSSCGCLRPGGLNRKEHGLSKTKLYKTWCHMKSRCYNLNQKGYRRYGGRGIKVCDEWLTSYETFMKWALENGYQENLSIDRIDNDGNYEPSNCRWATDIQQARNKSQQKLFYATSPIGRRYIGKCQTEFAEEHKMKPKAINDALTRGCKPVNGWQFAFYRCK